MRLTWDEASREWIVSNGANVANVDEAALAFPLIKVMDRVASTATATVRALRWGYLIAGVEHAPHIAHKVNTKSALTALYVTESPVCLARMDYLRLDRAPVAAGPEQAPRFVTVMGRRSRRGRGGASGR